MLRPKLEACEQALAAAVAENGKLREAAEFAIGTLSSVFDAEDGLTVRKLRAALGAAGDEDTVGE